MTNFTPMQFKNPEILYFLFLLVIPILVHLFQLRKFQKEYFTNVRFLKALILQTRKSSKLQKWLLLLTRLLLLTALIFAFAQPFFKAKEHTAAHNDLIVVLDNSHSMQAKGQKGELLKRSVQELLESIPENVPFTLYTADDVYANTDIKAIQKELQSLKYSSNPFDLAAIFATIQSKKGNPGKDLIVITDAVGLSASFLKNPNPNWKTFYLIPKAEQKNNVSIDSVLITQTLENFYEIQVNLTGYGKMDVEIPVALYHQNQLMAKTKTRLENTQQNVVFTIPKEDFHGYVTLEDGSLPYDNTYYFSITKPEKINLISIGSSRKSGFLERIYTPDEFDYSNFEITALNYNFLEKQQAIILNELEEIPAALQINLKSFVAKGGNLIIIPSSKIKPETLNVFLSSFGSLAVGPLETGEKLITQIAFSHPLFQNVFEKKITNFQYPQTKSNFAVRTKNAPILSYQDQSPFLTSTQHGLGNVYLFSGAVALENSNFQNAPLIVPTFYNMPQSKQNSLLAFPLGKTNTIVIAAAVEKDEIVSLTNATQRFIPIQQIVNGQVKITLANLPLDAGNYQIEKKEHPIKNISLNFDRQESNLFDLKRSLLKEEQVMTNLARILDTLQTNRTDQQLWKWFVWLTLLMVVLEILIQKFIK